VEALPGLLAGGRLAPQDRHRLEELTEELPELARDLHENAVHLREVTAGLSQFLYARIAEEPARAIDPMPLVKNAIAVCRDVAVRARGHIIYEGPAILPRVRIGATELTQVLINLISNAAQALLARARPDGRVRVTARNDDALVTFHIQDDGVGMAPEVLARVGTPFFTTRQGGIGLGLAQCQRLVGKSGGSFRIDSQPGVGTTVTFALPVG
jgi:signal transduction histidine kinase